MFYITATEYYLLLSVLRISSTQGVTNNSFSKNTTFDLSQCIQGNGEVVMKILEVGKPCTSSMFFAIFHFFSAVIQRQAQLTELFNRPQLQPKPSFDKLYVCVEVSTKTDAVMLNFYQWCQTPSSAFSKKFPATTPIFCTFSVEPLVIYNCALYN